MTTTTIYVNPHVISANHDQGRLDPPIIVQSAQGTHYGHAVHVLGPSCYVYSPDKPNEAGARLWCETDAPVVVRDTETGQVWAITNNQIEEGSYA